MSEILENFNFKNKTIVILGGEGLIGRALVEGFVETQAKVVVLDLENAVDKDRVFFKKVDVAQLEILEDFFSNLKKEFGYVDAFINASYPRTTSWGKGVEETSLESLKENVDIHLNSYSWLTRIMAMLMKDKGGSIINFSSIYGMLGNDFSVYQGTAMTSPMEYSVIKGGITNLTRYMASYFGPYGVRVNTVSPGGVLNHQDETFVQKYIQKTPLGRMAKPEDMVGIVQLLASDLSSYITGQNIVVDGGWSIW
ncbi:MAG: SDR family oxidoreductase [Candidatus Omnitrophica bacterium]|nr:SDR family oxidoreductase [Candidatus Omnitrophota bacterium]